LWVLDTIFNPVASILLLPELWRLGWAHQAALRSVYRFSMDSSGLPRQGYTGFGR